MVNAGLHQSHRHQPKVLQVHHFRYGTIGGGVDKVVTELADGLCENEVVLFEVGNWEDRRLTRREEGGLVVYRRRLKMLFKTCGIVRKIHALYEVFITLMQLVMLIKRERINVVHLHTLQDYHWYFAILARLGVCPYIVTLHRAETLEYPKRVIGQRKRWKKVLEKASVVTSVSAELSHIAAKNLPIKSSPVVIYNGISDPKKKITNVESSLGLNRNMETRFALCVGVLKSYKGHDIAIRAWKKLKAQGVNIKLIIAGEGEERQSLQGIINSIGCSDRVKLIGNIPHDEVLALVRQADIFLMPSRNEGLGLALIEAAALETPIIASDIPVFREILTNGESACLFKTGDASDLAQAVVRLLENPELAEQLMKAARQRFCDAFIREEMINGYRDLYLRIGKKRV